MQSSGARKRAGQAATAIAPQPQPDQNLYDFSNPPYPTNFDYSSGGFVDPNQALDDDAYANNLSNLQYPSYAGNAAAPTSTELVKRSRNAPGEQWDQYGGPSHQTDDEDEQELELKVAAAKRDAQGKRKQIPPFVQKLSSFLDSGNTDLIRCTDDGRSFIVIDEDEFARTLIPELFKHNNYASFVRQLNMYGFHKTVNITDGSLRQSEKARKGVKPPSMYSHPYFRRNRPDLLWLIQKPSGKATGKRRRDGTTKGEDSDDERLGSPGVDTKPLGELSRTGSHEMVTMPKSELNKVRHELIELRKQQKYIRDVIDGLKKQNDQFYRQATQSQAVHERHENSINAILTFLATFYNRSLEGHAGQNLVNMFAGISQQNNQPKGSVVEDIGESTQDMNNNQMQTYRRQPLLLGPPTSTLHPQGSVTTAPASARSSMSPIGVDNRRSSGRLANTNTNPTYQSSPLVKTEALSPGTNDQMMSLINTVNANSPGTDTPNLDFSAALNHYQNANGHAPLTQQQRNDVLSMINNQQNNASSSSNALTTPAPPMPDLNQYKETQAQLDMLQNMQKAQDEKVQELNRRLQPLSPTGAIPGLGEGDGFFDSTGAPGDFDPNSFLNFDNDADIDFDFTNAGGDDGVDWSFGNSNTNGITDSGDVAFDGSGDQDTEHLQPSSAVDDSERGRIESVSSAATTPTAAAVPDGSEEPSLPAKRQRRT